MLTFDIRSTGALVRAELNDLQKKHLLKAQLQATERTGRYVYGALRSEMEEVFDRPTRWALQGVQISKATLDRPVFTIWINETPNKGIPGVKFLTPQIEGGSRNVKRFERALQTKGLMPAGWFAVPGRQAPLDAHGNVPASFIVRMLSDLQAFGEQGHRANRKGERRGARKTNYFFVPRKGSHLKPGVYWHMPGGLLGVVFIFVSRVSYEKRYDFYGTGQRAFNQVALRFMSESLAKLIRRDNR